MSDPVTPPIGVIADDITGALDTGVQFVRVGLTTTLQIHRNGDDGATVQVISTDSRDAPVDIACDRVAEAARYLAGRRLFKKIDSTMRGHIGPELAALLHVSGAERIVVCPSVVEVGRQVRDGQLWVGETLLHASDFARDPAWPATTSALADLIGLSTTHMSLDTIRAGVTHLAQSLMYAPTPVISVDACTNDDLATICAAIVKTDSIPCGALGLARAWARTIAGRETLPTARTSTSQGGPVLVVAGSRHPRTHAQLTHLSTTGRARCFEVRVGSSGFETGNGVDVGQVVAALEDGLTAILHASTAELSNPADQRALVDILGSLAAQICHATPIGGLVLTGGETASAVCDQLGASGVHIQGEVESGVPWGTLVAGSLPDLRIVTKAGGFGSHDTLINAVQALTMKSL